MRKLLLVILITAAFFRLWGAFDVSKHIDDENLHATDAVAIAHYGTTANWGWHHPQLSGFIMYGTIKLFGDTPAGRRSSNIFFGTASVALLFRVGSLLYPASAVPLLAAAFLAFDPHNIYISRTSFVEIPVTFFFLLYLWFLLEHTENGRKTLPLAGIACGLTIATKSYFSFAIPLTAAYAFHRNRQRGITAPQSLADLAASLLLLPLTIYLVSYLQWFGRGHTIMDLFRMKLDGLWALNRLSLFNGQAYLEAGGKPWEWFLKPFFWGQQRLINSQSGQFLLQCNNIPVRIFVLPALCITVAYGTRQRISRELLAPAIFLVCYALLLAVTRPMFSYSSTVLLPFAYLMLARAALLPAGNRKHEKAVLAGIIVLNLLWVLYLFPLLSARTVSIAPFKPVLSLVTVWGAL